ncbi:uncharacterized protein LOC110641920 [Hevea brasiliensis]|uniref:uncharacterized protein LOC110641920 n=1 Tax=Hevea brasiliensis TaxID=3981 RepID=UPI0025D8AEFA|nr:uncharacterized protein LOC110641920 [Hevea brasiliensis]
MSNPEPPPSQQALQDIESFAESIQRKPPPAQENQDTERKIKMPTITERRRNLQDIAKEEWESVKEFYKKYPDCLLDTLNTGGDTVFHIAMHSKTKKRFVDLKEIAQSCSMGNDLFFKRNRNGNTILHEAAATGNTEVMEIILNDHSEPIKLIEIKNILGENPIFTAAAFGQKEIVKLLTKFNYGENADNGMILAQSIIRFDDEKSILQVAIEGEHLGFALYLHLFLLNNGYMNQMFDSQFDYNLFYLPMHADTALLLLKLYESLWRLEDNESLWRLENDERPWLLKDTYGRTTLDALANMPSAFKSGHTMGVFETLLYKCLPVHDETETEVSDILGQSSMREQDLEMEGSAVTTEIAIEHKVLKENNHNQSIWKFMKGWPMVGKIWKEKRKHTFALKLARSLIKLTDPKRCQTLLFTATEMGIVEIVRATIEEYPQVIDQLNGKLQNILHVAVLHRRKEIFDKLRGYMGEIQWKRMTEAFAGYFYTLLHQVASTEFYTGGTRPGPALQLQEELMWFERVKRIVPSHYVMQRVTYGEEQLTAKEMFKRTHEAQLKEAREWIKETSQACFTVAALVVAVVFAAVFTIPGGLNDKGSPVFRDSPYFLLFTIMDVISLVFSLSTILAFLSIHTYPLEFDDFRHSIPHKLVLGFTLLTLSMISTMLAFGATILLIIRTDKQWTTILIYVLVFFPVSLFVLLQARLYWVLMIELFHAIRRLFSGLGFLSKSSKRK